MRWSPRTETGHTRDGSGRFTGTAKPIPPEPQEAAGDAQEAKPDAEPEDGEKAAPEPAEAAGAAPESDDEGAEAEPKRSRAQERIRELVEERNAERDARARLEARLQALEQRDQPTQATQPRQDRLVQAEAEPPKADDFDDYNDYVAALTEFKSDQKVRAFAHDMQAKQFAKEYKESVETAEKQFAAAMEEAGGKAFAESLPDRLRYLEPSFVLPQGTEIKPVNVLSDEIVRSGKRAPALITYLRDHEDVHRRLLSASSQSEYDRLMGRIEADIERVTAGKSRNEPPPFTPTAKPPVKPVTGSPPSAGDDDPSDDDDDDTWYAKRRAMDKRKQARS